MRTSLAPLSLTVAPASATIIDIERVREHCSVDGEALDSLLEIYQIAAIMWAEDFMDRTILARSHRWVLRGFPHQLRTGSHFYGDWRERNTILLPRGKTISVTAIDYVENNELKHLYGPTSGSPVGDVASADFQEDLNADSGGRLLPLVNESWPSSDITALSPVIVRFEAGYATAAEVPKNMIHAILFAITDMLEVRGVADVNTLMGIAASGRTFSVRDALLSPWAIKRVY